MATPGLILPALTRYIMIFRIPLAIVALSWPLIGIVVARRRKAGAIHWSDIALILTLLQIAVTIWALSTAMWEISGVLVGMPDGNHP